MAKPTSARAKTAQIIVFPRRYRQPPEPERDDMADALLKSRVFQILLEAELEVRSTLKGENP